jgi:hypothetical protein
VIGSALLPIALDLALRSHKQRQVNVLRMREQPVLLLFMTAGPDRKLCAWGEEHSRGLYLSLEGCPLVHSVLTPLTVPASGLRNTPW